MVIAIQRSVYTYINDRGVSPFVRCFKELRSEMVQQIILVRIDRMKLGLDKNEKALGDGVYELKISHGPGYRIYFGKDGPKIVVLLCGGTKQRQNKDVKQAKEFWRDYLESRNAEEM